MVVACRQKKFFDVISRGALQFQLGIKGFLAALLHEPNDIFPLDPTEAAASGLNSAEAKLVCGAAPTALNYFFTQTSGKF
jgi:hypothetical protein